MRLSSLSEYNKYLKQWIARRANLEDDCTGHFFEGRFRSIVLLNELARLMCALYVLLNPVTAGVAARVEDCEETSLQTLMRSARRLASQRRGVTRRETGALLAEIERMPVEPAIPAQRVARLVGSSTSLEHPRVPAWLRSGRHDASPPRPALDIALGEFLRRLRHAESRITAMASARLDTIESSLGSTSAEGVCFVNWLVNMTRRSELPRGTVAGDAASMVTEAVRRGMRRVVDALGVDRVAPFSPSGTRAGPS